MCLTIRNCQDSPKVVVSFQGLPCWLRQSSSSRLCAEFGFQMCGWALTPWHQWLMPSRPLFGCPFVHSMKSSEYLKHCPFTTALCEFLLHSRHVGVMSTLPVVLGLNDSHSCFQREIFLECVWVFTSMYVCELHMGLVPLKVKSSWGTFWNCCLQEVVNWRVGAGNGTHVLWARALSRRAISPAPVRIH